MALSPEIRQQIEKLIAETAKGSFKRPGMSINKFISAYSTLTAQTETDLASLVASGFNSSNMPFYQGLLEMLLLTVGERRGTISGSEEKQRYFTEQMFLANLDRKRLIVVGAYIDEMLNDRNVNRYYREIIKGSSNVDTLCDNLALVTLIRKHLDIAAQIRPGKFEVNEAYCTEVSRRAVELLALKGFTVDQGVPENDLVDRQNRIITLCMNAIADIRLFAKAAFFDDLEYYNANYAAPFRTDSPASTDTQDTVTATEKATS